MADVWGIWAGDFESPVEYLGEVSERPSILQSNLGVHSCGLRSANVSQMHRMSVRVYEERTCRSCKCLWKNITPVGLNSEKNSYLNGLASLGREGREIVPRKGGFLAKGRSRGGCQSFHGKERVASTNGVQKKFATLKASVQHRCWVISPVCRCERECV